MFGEEENLKSICKKKNPMYKNNRKVATQKKQTAFVVNPNPPKAKGIVKSKMPKQIHQQSKKVPRALNESEVKQIQDKAGQYTANDTIVIHKSGDEFWSIIASDAKRVSDFQIYQYMYRRFGYKACDLDIIRPK